MDDDTNSSKLNDIGDGKNTKKTEMDMSEQIDELSLDNHDSKIFEELPGFEFKFFEEEKNDEDEAVEDDQQKDPQGTDTKTRDVRAKRKYAYMVHTNWIPKFDLDLELPFTPDTFQLQSFYLLQHHKSILVTAHTSSGKTTIVDYAIHQCRKHKTKVIYTSPIKALSNQKYNEFKRFGPGIITGDVSLNTSSDILIMTTEILRNLLYSKSPLLSDLEIVVFDEVHYINNRDRGVIWEECIIMLPRYVTIVMLSACIPNALEFGAWVGRVRESEVYVIETLKRVVPLEYFICEKEKIRSLIKQSTKTNDARGVQNKNAKSHKQPQLTSVSKNIVSTRKKDNLLYIVNYIIRDNLTPCIIFCFSKRKCHENAKRIIKPYIREFERKKILEIIKTRFEDKIKMEDRSLPQILEMHNLLINGIAIHHSGLLPILKELIEILFSKGLIKILFATETFSMGVNFPAKCVVFLSIKKMDDKMRVLLPGEFMQMSGRAGRRGTDKKGIVIVNYENERLDDNIEFTVNKLVKSRCALHSKFKLTYNMILQLLRSKMKVEDILKKSFCEENVQKDISSQILLLSKLEKLYNSITAKRIIYNNREQSEGSHLHVLDCKICVDIRNLVHMWKTFYIDNNEFIQFYLKTCKDTENLSFVTCDMNEIEYKNIVDKTKMPRKYCIDNIDVTDYYSNFVKYDLDLNNSKSSDKLYSIEDVLYIKRNNEPFFDYDVKIIDRTLKLIETKESFAKVNSHICYKCPDFFQHYAQTIDIMIFEQKIADIKKLFDTKSLLLFEDYFEKLTFLIDRDYIDSDHNLKLKGQLACEIKTVDEIVITECLINNYFQGLSTSDILAFVSMIITHEEDKTDFENEDIKEIIKSLKKVYDINFYSAYFIPIKLWCEGKSFSEIITCYRVSEGILIRTILRLDEWCKEVLNCCAILNDVELSEKIEEVRKILKRDIVSCNSLYFDE